MAVMALLSLGVILAPAGSANAATQMYCAQVKGGATGPDCSFSSLNDCRTDVCWFSNRDFVQLGHRRAIAIDHSDSGVGIHRHA